MPFLALRHLCLLVFFDSFWRLFSLVHVFLSPLKFPNSLYLKPYIYIYIHCSVCDPGFHALRFRNDSDNTMENRMTLTRKQKWEGKQFYGRFKRLINNISHDKTWTWLRKGNFKRETESLLIAAQNNAIRTNLIKAIIDETQ